MTKNDNNYNLRDRQLEFFRGILENENMEKKYGNENMEMKLFTIFRTNIFYRLVNEIYCVNVCKNVCENVCKYVS